MIRWDRQQQQVWFCRQRIHHGAVGVILGVVGLLLAWHDRHDGKVWFRADRYEHPTKEKA